MPDSTQRSASSRPRSLDLYTVSETAAILGVSERLVSEWIKEEFLPVVRLGPGQRLVRIRRTALEDFIEHDFRPSSPPGQGGSLRGEKKT
jgi:excisionase family DNA binding protein